jgi:hypothetical protein
VTSGSRPNFILFVMLPVYKAISFQRVLEKGGRTKPWIVLVQTDQGIVPYVVKLFEPAFVEERDPVANEVIGNTLAREFGLPVPKAALIDLDEDFVSTIRNPRLLEVLDLRDGRLKFGSELLEGSIRFNLDATNLSASAG